MKSGVTLCHSVRPGLQRKFYEAASQQFVSRGSDFTAWSRSQKQKYIYKSIRISLLASASGELPEAYKLGWVRVKL